MEKLWVDPKVFRKSANDVVPPLITEAVTKRREDIAKMPVAKTLEQLSPVELMNKYEHLLNSFIDSRFKPWPMPEEIRKTVRLLIVDAIRAVLPSPLSSGLIVAGYGKDDNYPSVTSIDIHGYVMGHLKYSKIDEKAKIEKPELGYAVSFAQRDVIERLLSGADPRFIKKTSDFLGEVAEQLSPIIVDALIEKSSRKRKKSEEQRVRKVLEVKISIFATRRLHFSLSSVRNSRE